MWKYNLPALKPSIGRCDIFQDSVGQMTSVTIIIVPLGVVRRDDSTLTFKWACNHGKACFCETCAYSVNNKLRGNRQ